MITTFWSSFEPSGFMILYDVIVTLLLLALGVAASYKRGQFLVREYPGFSTGGMLLVFTLAGIFVWIAQYFELGSLAVFARMSMLGMLLFFLFSGWWIYSHGTPHPSSGEAGVTSDDTTKPPAE